MQSQLVEATKKILEKKLSKSLVAMKYCPAAATFSEPRRTFLPPFILIQSGQLGLRLKRRRGKTSSDLSRITFGHRRAGSGAKLGAGPARPLFKVMRKKSRSLGRVPRSIVARLTRFTQNKPGEVRKAFLPAKLIAIFLSRWKQQNPFLRTYELERRKKNETKSRCCINTDQTRFRETFEGSRI